MPGLGPGRWIAALLVAAAVGTAYAVYTGALYIPDRHNPWAPLDAQAPPDRWAHFKLARAKADPARCLAALARTDMQYEPVPDRSTGEGCGFSNAVRLQSAAVRFGGSLTLSCPMALSFHQWERHGLQPAAAERVGQRLVAIEHAGSYACRNINRGEGAVPGASRSRHATADALDVTAFVLADGQRVTVQNRWSLPANDSDRAGHLLLRDAYAAACRYFDGVLGPDYNAAHRDHFHLETGGYSMCR
ncbi:extensin-like domain-containing protein [Variovorax sp. LT2P21]|uniref:extensin-like domain-containing protein n=1 Tax=Variovorax sp. LT2P21 TaxID=3443731 RepID=UPI003F446EC2